MGKTTAIRLSITPEVRAALDTAKRRYPALTDPEILKLGLSQIVSNDNGDKEHQKTIETIRRRAAEAAGNDYLSDPAEELYDDSLGKPVAF